VARLLIRRGSQRSMVERKWFSISSGAVLLLLSPMTRYANLMPLASRKRVGAVSCVVAIVVISSLDSEGGNVQ
jgi:hypothetical protein